MGPISTGLGEIYQFKVTGAGYSPMDLRSILDWDIAPKLRRVPGIVEVNSHGGELKTYEIQVDSDKLMAYRIPLATIIKALEENNANAGGAYLEHAEQQSLIRGEALISNLSDIEQIVLGVSPSGTPITVKNVAQVRFAPMVRQGFATQDGKGEIVLGIAMMLVGENSRTVVDDVKTRLADIQKSLPKGIRIEPFYDRTDLVRRTIETVRKNLGICLPGQSSLAETRDGGLARRSNCWARRWSGKTKMSLAVLGFDSRSRSFLYPPVVWPKQI